VAILDMGEWQGQHYLVKPLLPGGSLQERLRVGGPLPPTEAVRMVLQVAEALEYAHRQGVWHNDVKPAKILFDGAGRPQITGFGQLQPLPGTVAGTPAYLAPERWAGESGPGPQADLYALGVVLYQTLTGHTPIEGNVREIMARVLLEDPRPPSTRNPRVPQELDLICLKCLAREPEQRYGSVAALAEDLGSFLQTMPLRAGRVATPSTVSLAPPASPAAAAPPRAAERPRPRARVDEEASTITGTRRGQAAPPSAPPRSDVRLPAHRKLLRPTLLLVAAAVLGLVGLLLWWFRG
jgi:serine/threonine protein kinase